MTTVLVSGASGIVGYGMLRSLRRSSPEVRLIGTTIYDDSAAAAFCDVFEQAVRTEDPAYVTWLTGVIAEHDVDLLMPGIEADMFNWMEHRADIERTGARALLNRPELIALCRDKWTFYEQLVSYGLPYAIESSLASDFDELATAFGLPFLLKPRRGFGSKGIVRVDGPTTFEQHRHDIGALLMAQPIVGRDDEEYSTSAFGDGQGGAYASMTLRRTLSSQGYTETAEVVESDAIAEAVARLCGRFTPIGPTNFQFRVDDGDLKLLEINPRVSSATSIRTAFGYNEAHMAVEYFLHDRAPAQPAIRTGRAVRYVDEVIFYDDTEDPTWQ